MRSIDRNVIFTFYVLLRNFVSAEIRFLEQSNVSIIPTVAMVTVAKTTVAMNFVNMNVVC